MARNGYSAEEADKRIQAQMTNAERIARADRVSTPYIDFDSYRWSPCLCGLSVVR